IGGYLDQRLNSLLVALCLNANEAASQQRLHCRNGRVEAVLAFLDEQSHQSGIQFGESFRGRDSLVHKVCKHTEQRAKDRLNIVSASEEIAEVLAITPVQH